MLRYTYLVFQLATLFELLFSVTLLILFACAYPDRFRTALWQDGGTKGWNSDPHERVYYYANYREAPPIPWLWDESSSLCYLAIAAFTVFVWIVRFNVNVFVYDAVLFALWSYSVAGQNSGDFSDTMHVSIRPWYLERGCGDALEKNRCACNVARVSYWISIFAAFWFGLRLIVTGMYRAYLLGREHELQDMLYGFSDIP
ncbi:hypothetical protein IQ07DRAFT_293628 [Pyrenochaeta sp. DS3sAY3a]|nr:hypothetical protein IQ07DRAFT_293628 [Pyrenochaeta sp. DS3sAY3a]